MKKELMIVVLLLFTAGLMTNCGSKNSSPVIPKDSHDTEGTTVSSNDGSVGPGRLVNVKPNTGLTLSYEDGDYDALTTHQVVMFDYTGLDITRVVSENRYFKQVGNDYANAGCDVFYYAHDSKRLEQIVVENNTTVRNVLIAVGDGTAVEKFGGSYNPDGHWFFQSQFVNNINRCSESIAGSQLMQGVREGRAEIRYFEESWQARDALNNQ